MTKMQNTKKFQMGSNPVQEDSFEQRLVKKEKMDREEAKRKYVLGIQGVDGGKCHDTNHHSY